MKSVNCFVLVLFPLIFGCDLAKPQGKIQQKAEAKANSQNLLPSDTTPGAVAEASTVSPPVKEVVREAVTDTFVKLDKTFEDKEYGFRFNYSADYSLENRGTGEGVQGILGAGKLNLWFPQSERKFDNNAVVMTVEWMMDYKLFSLTKEQMKQDVRKRGGSLQLFEKIKLDGQDCTHIKVNFGGGMLDTIGNRVSEQYILNVKSSDLIINFSAPANKFKTVRPQFEEVLKSFKIDK
jgi:hypothetical protein